MNNKLEFPNIKELQEELDRLLKERPEYRLFQKNIERALEKAGDNKHNRNVVIQKMMMDSMKELQNKMKQLAEELNKINGDKDE